MEWCCGSVERRKGRLEWTVLVAEGTQGVNGSPVCIRKAVVLIGCEGMNEDPGASGELIKDGLDDACVRIRGGGWFGELVNMEGVHLGSNLIHESLKDIINGIRDRLPVINDGVDEPEEVVGKGTIRGFV